MSGERDRFEDVGRAIRRAHQAAHDAGATPAERDVLLAIIALVCSYSRLVDRVSIARLADAAGRHPETVRAALARLDERGVVRYEGGSGRGHLSLVGLPPDLRKGQSPEAALLAENGQPLEADLSAVKGSKTSRKGQSPETGHPRRTPRRTAADGASARTHERPHPHEAAGGQSPELGRVLSMLAERGDSPNAGQRAAIASACRENAAGVVACLERVLDAPNVLSPAALLTYRLTEAAHLSAGRPRVDPVEHARRLIANTGHELRDEAAVERALERLTLTDEQVLELVAEWRARPEPRRMVAGREHVA